MDLQAIHDSMSQQNLIMQRMERNMRRMEDSYGRVIARLDALEAKGQTSPADTHESRRHRRSETADATDTKVSEEPEKVDDKTETPSEDSLERENKGQAFTARVKSAIRSSIQDGSVNATLDKFQASIKLTDEATGALSEIASLVKTSLEQDQSVTQVGSVPIPGGSLALLLEMAKTPQFQRFIANIVAQALKEAEA